MTLLSFAAFVRYWMPINLDDNDSLLLTEMKRILLRMLLEMSCSHDVCRSFVTRRWRNQTAAGLVGIRLDIAIISAYFAQHYTCLMLALIRALAPLVTFLNCLCCQFTIPVPNVTMSPMCAPHIRPGERFNAAMNYLGQIHLHCIFL